MKQFNILFMQKNYTKAKLDNIDYIYHIHCGIQSLQSVSMWRIIYDILGLQIECMAIIPTLYNIINIINACSIE